MIQNSCQVVLKVFPWIHFTNQISSRESHKFGQALHTFGTWILSLILCPSCPKIDAPFKIGQIALKNNLHLTNLCRSLHFYILFLTLTFSSIFTLKQKQYFKKVCNKGRTHLNYHKLSNKNIIFIHLGHFLVLPFWLKMRGLE